MMIPREQPPVSLREQDMKRLEDAIRSNGVGCVGSIVFLYLIFMSCSTYSRLGEALKRMERIEQRQQQESDQ